MKYFSYSNTEGLHMFIYRWNQLWIAYYLKYRIILEFPTIFGISQLILMIKSSVYYRLLNKKTLFYFRETAVVISHIDTNKFNQKVIYIISTPPWLSKKLEMIWKNWKCLLRWLWNHIGFITSLFQFFI